MSRSHVKSEGKSADKKDPAAVIKLNLTGLKCPLPVLKARRQISQMATGSRIDIMADDPAAPLDFKHFCSTGGHDLVEMRSEGEIFTFRICVGNGPTT